MISEGLTISQIEKECNISGMAFGFLSASQKSTLAPYILGKIVHDLGAGDCSLSQQLVELGANVVAVDRMMLVTSSVPGLRKISSQFEHFRDFIDIAFVSWPMNLASTGILRLIKQARIVVYLGKNTDGNACGSSEIFEYLIQRSILSHIPDVRNSLIIYNNQSFEFRQPVGEEFAALEAITNPHKIWSFEEAERVASSL